MSIEENDDGSTPPSLLDASNNCDLCKQIAQSFINTDKAKAVNFGSWKEALSTECETHKPLLQSFWNYLTKIQTHWIFNNYGGLRPDSTDVGFGDHRKGESIRMYESIKNLGMNQSLLLVKKEDADADTDTLHHPGNGRILDPEWADLEILNKWKQKCISDHGATCENSMKLPPTRPNFLIDVEKRCIVPGYVDENKPFVALSYIWGDHSSHKSPSVEHWTQLLEPLGLDNPDLQQYITLIVKHAMHLTSEIGERYLWVDALCITHHDIAATSRQLQMMGAIYASAIVTVVNTDGDAKHGIPGLKGISEPRDLDQRVIPFGKKEQFIVRNTGAIFSSDGKAYRDRGWTFQEHKMSNRQILIVKKELHWQCQCSVWHEELILDVERDKHVDPRLKIILEGYPDLEDFGYIVADYNEKELTYDDDGLSAISGLLSIISRSFIGGFLYGTPEMFFDRGLGWMPY